MEILETRNKLIELLGTKEKVCEIGVFKGEFSDILLKKLNPKELHLIDIFEGTICSGDKDGNNIVWTDLNEEYNKLLDKYKTNDKVILHKGKSIDILSTFENDYFDLIYIDGDHGYNGVKSDLLLALLKTKIGGLICGHDYDLGKFPGVFQAVNEFCQQNNLEIKYITKDGCPSFCIIKK